jgi:hypothetical protein
LTRLTGHTLASSTTGRGAHYVQSAPPASYQQQSRMPFVHSHRHQNLNANRLTENYSVLMMDAKRTHHQQQRKQTHNQPITRSNITNSAAPLIGCWRSWHRPPSKRLAARWRWRNGSGFHSQYFQSATVTRSSDERGCAGPQGEHPGFCHTRRSGESGAQFQAALAVVSAPS